jgi:hypothetical protein
MRLLLMLASILALTSPAFAQPKDSDFNGDGCVTRDEIITFYRDVRPDVNASVKYEDDKLIILTSPTRPTDLHISIGPDGCLLPLAVEVEKEPEVNV